MAQRQLVWLRNDLRIDDNRALAAAACQGPVIALLTPCYQQMAAHGHGGNKQDFWYRSAQDVKEALEALHIPVRIITADTFDDLPTRIIHLMQETECSHLYFNDEYGLNERQRDIQVVKAAKEAGVTALRYTDAIQFTPGDLKTGKGEFYSVFTPFAKAWHRALSADQLAIMDTPSRQTRPSKVESDQLPAPETPSSIDAKYWPAGAEEAQQRLSGFIQERLHHYDDQRDFPALDGTSTLSPWLAVGAISSRQCLNAILHHNHGHLADGDANCVAWVNELIWREFYQHIMVGFPRVCCHQPFREEGKNVAWRDAPDELAAWQEGRTGYPIVDAAMRQLTTTGWMHNRLRMVVSMFLTKHLLIDWREGEAFFLKHLVDGEFGANNGGWQWGASTGTDASPYFRLFNPTTQSQRFDSDGTFLCQWLEGFDQLALKARHQPNAEQRREIAYPAPLVDHRAARQRALDTFADAFKHNN